MRHHQTPSAPSRRTVLFGIGAGAGSLALTATSAAAYERGPDSKPPTNRDQQAATELEQYVRELHGQQLFFGTVALARHGRLMMNVALGEADRERNLPLRPRSRMCLASIGKSLTALACGRAADLGLLSFDATLAELKVPAKDPYIAALTLHDLLTHTSGLPIWSPDALDESPSRAMTDYIPRIEALGPRLTRGSFNYSNAGFVLVGAALEAITGNYYDEVLTSWVLRPARTTTMPVPHGQQPPSSFSVARHYPVDSEAGNVGEPMPFFHTDASGGLYASGWDMLAIDAALRSGRILKRDTLKTLEQPRVSLSPDLSYGYGFGIKNVDGHRVVEHNGGAPGVSTWFQRWTDPADGYTLVVLCNASDPRKPEFGAGPVVFRAEQLLTGQQS